MIRDVMELRGVSVILVDADEQSFEGFAPLRQPTRTVLAMEVPSDGDVAALTRHFDLTKSVVEQYLFIYQAAGNPINDPAPAWDEEAPLEADAEDNLAKLLRARLRIDVPYQIERSWTAGLRAAWALVRPGDRLIIASGDTDGALELLRQVSAEVRGGSEGLAPRTPFYDEALPDDTP